MKPDFNRVKTALFCGIPDRVPLVELKVETEVKEAFLGKPIKSLQDDIEFSLKAGYDYIRIRPEYDFHRGLTTSKEADYTVYKDNKQEIKWVTEAKGFINNEEEFKKFQWPTEKDINYSKLEQINKCLPDGMGLISGCTGIWESVWMTMGLDSFSYNLVENPSLIERVFENFGNIHFNMWKKAISFKNIGAMWYTDDMAYTEGLMVSPTIYRKYLFPWLKKMGDLCKEKNIPFILHSDGKLFEILDDLINVGFNAIHPIEPKAMDIVELKKRVAGKLCLIGNIDLGYTLTRGTPNEVRKEVKERLKFVAPGGGYCVSSSNSVTNYVPVENYKAMNETVLEFGKYPIDIPDTFGIRDNSL
jgi:uroporphyrinogen decarboxylase